MPTIADLKPGATIYSVATSARGTFTCFARKPGVKKLFGVTAKHLLPDRTYCQLGDPNDFTSKVIVFGGPAQHLAGMDGLFFEIDEDLSKQLTQNNFVPVGYTVEPIQVWESQKYRKKIDNAQTISEEGALKLKEIAIKHVGSTQMSAQTSGNKAPTTGTLKKNLNFVYNTQIAKGDSGGCVLHGSKQKYVGLISSGWTDIASESGSIVYLDDLFKKAGMVLATWADKAQWLG